MKSNSIHQFQKHLLQLLIIVSISSISISCQRDINYEFEVPETAAIYKSNLVTGKYIVLFDENEVDFKKPGNAADRKTGISAHAKDVAKKANVAESNIDNIYSNVFPGFSVKLTTAQVAQMKNDKRVTLIKQDRELTIINPGIENISNGNGNKNGKGNGININSGKNSTTKNNTTTDTTSTTTDTTSTETSTNILPENYTPAEQPAQTIPWNIQRVGGSGDGTGKTAWIVDSGIELLHPDLNVDLQRSISFVDYTPNDLFGHGTRVAGIIGAKNNDIGIMGVAANATLVAVKVISNTGGTYLSLILKGLDYVAENANVGDVVNLSFGGPGMDVLDDAVRVIARKGVFVVCAAGNSKMHASNVSPARIIEPNVYTISSIDRNDVWSSFSNFGNPPIQFTAPGSSVLTTGLNGTYHTTSGTSFSAPHVAGILLLNNGKINIGGYAINDPDGIPDPIAVR
jgi:hypothetical protein